MKNYGIQINDDGDLNIANKSLVIGNTLAQNEFILLMAQRGELKDNPLMGVGIADMIGDNDATKWKRKIIDGFADDGLKVSTVRIEDNKLSRLEAEYDG